ncbi:MAG: sigma-70 family RNA polymerase sigma factor [Caulobacteraceae bacterium]
MTSKPDERPLTPDFERDLIVLIPHMRAFARSLCGDPAQADDLAQDAVAKALKARASYQLGSNMKAWLFMIVRNQFYSEKRRSWRGSQLDQDVAERTLHAVDDPGSVLELNDVRMALKMLPDVQREALVMVGAGGFSYEEAAAVAGVAVGTMKSRVSRARGALQATLVTGAFDRDKAPAHEAMSAILTDVRHCSDLVAPSAPGIASHLGYSAVASRRGHDLPGGPAPA